MSFFGFKTALPRDQLHPSKAPGFGQVQDQFASLSNKLANSSLHDDDAIDFEDTYDGLGDQLDEQDDGFNDETFGVTGGSTSVGRDFDFSGQTARVSDIISEEETLFKRSALKRNLVGYNTALEASTLDLGSDSFKSNSKQTAQRQAIPDLQPEMSLWASPPAKREYPLKKAPHGYKVDQEGTAAAKELPTNRQFMTLEEVEAQILGQSLSTRPFHDDNSGSPFHSEHIYQTLADPQALQISIQTAHLTDMRTYEPPQSVTNTRDMQTPDGQVGQSPSPLHASDSVLSPQDATPGYPVIAPHETSSVQTLPQHPGYAIAPAPSLPIEAMSEEERKRIMEEESRRLKRNHKIAQMSRYNGLMTPQDKNFITRIQLQALVGVTEDVFVEDFYYQVYSAIKARHNLQQPLNHFAQTYLAGTRGRSNRASNHMQRMEQQVQRAVAAAKAKPKQNQLVAEGSLGKISFSNSKNPKQLLSIRKPEAPNIAEGRKKPSYAANRLALLRSLESVYDYLLELEMHERTPIPPVNSQGSQSHEEQTWKEKYERLIDDIWNAMRIDDPLTTVSIHPFIALIAYGKGKRAIPRLWRHIGQDQRITILTMTLAHLDTLDVVRNGQYMADETTLPPVVREDIELFSQTMLPPLLGIISDSGIGIVTGLLDVIHMRVDLAAVSRTKIGLLFLTMLVSRAEILKQGGGISGMETQKWTSSYDKLLQKLEPHLPDIFPPSSGFVDDMYVWQFLASVAVGASMTQQRDLVAVVKDRVLENVQASKTLPPELGAQKSANVNLFMRAIGLDVSYLGA